MHCCRRGVSMVRYREQHYDTCGYNPAMIAARRSKNARGAKEANKREREEAPVAATDAKRTYGESRQQEQVTPDVQQKRQERRPPETNQEAATNSKEPFSIKATYKTVPSAGVTSARPLLRPGTPRDDPQRRNNCIPL